MYFSKKILKSHNSKTKKDIYALKYGTPLVELNRFIEYLDSLHTCLRVPRATFDQLMKQLRKKEFFDRPTRYLCILFA